MAELIASALAPWFGAARMIAQDVGDELSGCKWVGVPFGGSLAEVARIDAPNIVVGDLHRHIMNLACVTANRTACRELYQALDRLPFHPGVLRQAQEWCKSHEPDDRDGDGLMRLDVRSALMYFVCAWMGRSGKSGTDDEFNGGLATRWNSNGGGSTQRYRSAVKSLAGWMQIMRRCTFEVGDCFDFLARCEDIPENGIYCDPPFPDVGEKYRHKFTEADHRRLAAVLHRFQSARIVCRFYHDHPLIREIYYEAPNVFEAASPGNGRWTWRPLKGGRKQNNEKAPEVLIMNGPSRARGPRAVLICVF